ncbi:hypothetical protein Tco_1218149 [Tanacetum coccineum]
MFMANLTSEEAGPSYDSNTTFEVQDHDTFVDHMDEYHEVHEMQNDVQHNYVVDSDADYTSDSNIIPYDQYVEDNEEHVVQSNVSSIRNDALMSILDEMHEQGVQSRSANKQEFKMALFKEVKVIEEIFDQMNDEVDQNTIDKQCAEIVKKNLLIENENLIANCLSNHLCNDVDNITFCPKSFEAECLEFKNDQNIFKTEMEIPKFAIKVWKATGKLFANVGYQWRSTGKKVALGKLNCGYQWRPTGKKFALGELCPLTKLSV